MAPGVSEEREADLTPALTLAHRQPPAGKPQSQSKVSIFKWSVEATSSVLFSQKTLQEASLRSEQKLKDTEKELRYVVRYIKVGFWGFIRLLRQKGIVFSFF